jgi:hypothetical protein
MRWMFVAFVLAVASPVFAQPAGPGGQTAQPQDRRERIKKRIRALRAYTLTEALDLDEPTAGKLFPLLAKFDDEFDKLLVARGELERRLRAAGTQTDGKAVDKLIDEAAANQKALWDTEVRRLGELRKILTPQQVARTLVVLPKMERQIQNQLRKAAMAKKARKAGAKGMPASDDDDPFGDDDDTPPPPRKNPNKPQVPKPRCDPFSTSQGCK